MSIKDWTPEQLESAKIWGMCQCGAPRMHEVISEDPPEKELAPEGRTVTMRVVCANGHVAN